METILKVSAKTSRAVVAAEPGRLFMIEKSFDVGGIICWRKRFPPRTGRVTFSTGWTQVRALVGGGSVSDYPTYQALETMCYKMLT